MGWGKEEIFLNKILRKEKRKIREGKMT